ncbi:MAG: hypothetical protein SF123_07710 [Chloroflexota bacterium]|nr:hypothetical protein [Chloroflexota bacterium]
MSRISKIVLVIVLVSLIASLFAFAPAMAQTNEAACPEGRPTAQVRFQNFPDIPVYASAADADLASQIFAGEVEAESIPQWAFRIRGGNQQKYLLCGAYDEEADSVRVVIGNGTWYVPAFLVSDVVRRNARDGQS